MQPKAYEELEKISSDIYEVCLERDHLNMVVTKMVGSHFKHNLFFQT